MPDIVSILLFLSPIYFANSSPVLFGGGKPIDLYKKFSDGFRIFGDGKTIKGFVSGVLIGTIVSYILNSLFYQSPFSNILLASFVLSFFTLLGDLIGSFLKRRMGVKQGNFSFFDSTFFMLISLLAAIILNPFLNFLTNDFFTFIADPFIFLLFIIISAFIHKFFNVLANQIGIKKVPW